MYLAYFEMLGSAEKWGEEIKHYQLVSRDDILNQANILFRESAKNTLYYKAVNN
jgi:hypothetical protein